MIQRISGMIFFMLIISKGLAQNNNLLQVETYKLENGLTVYLNPDSTATKVFGAVAVNAGSKNENPNATGMAHYLEHLLFKGTTTMGTLDYEKEKPHLDKIVELYDELAKAETDEQRLSIQKQINDQAVQAAQYGLPNEFDKLTKSIGGTGINAWTNYEQTFYHNSFPAHQINKWLDIYATRFQNPVFRSFQSELEVVYEEKNISIDDFENSIYYKMNELLYPNIPYGQWSVLGKVDHLKNPSLAIMYDFFEKNYVANNMALILSGNFDPNTVKPLIAEKFGKLRSGPEVKMNLQAPSQIEGIQKENVRITPIKVGFLGFHTPSRNHPDRLAMDIVEYLLSNGDQTGYLDQIMLKNDMMFCGSFQDSFTEVGGYTIFYVPKILIQSLGNGEKKVHHALDQVRLGKFDEALLSAAKQNLSQSFERRLEDVTARGNMIGTAFNRQIDWKEMLAYPEKIQQINKQQVVEAAAKYFGKDYVKLISRTGFPKKPKLKKPPYKAVNTEQKGESVYAKTFKELNSAPFKPRFIDFDRDVEQISFGGGHQLMSSKNPINGLFELKVKFRKGELGESHLYHAAKLMNNVGAGDFDTGGFKRAMASAGATYNVYSSENFITVEVRGDDAMLGETLALINQLLTNPSNIDQGFESYLNQLKTDNKRASRNPWTLGRAGINYGIYGKNSSYLVRGSLKDVKAMDPRQLVNSIREIASDYRAEINYTGSKSANQLSELIMQNMDISKNPKSTPLATNQEVKPKKNTIYFIPAKKTVQSHVYFYVPGKDVSKEDYAGKEAFNQYFGGGFSGLVLQEIREYRSLAYSAWGQYGTSPLKDIPGRLIGYIGCQSDKTNEAIGVMHDLITNLPEKQDRINSIRNTLQLKTLTDFPTFDQINDRIYNYQLKGYGQDPNEKAFEQYSTMEMEDIVQFYQNNIKDQPMVITIYGDKKRVDLEALGKIGNVIELDLKDVIKF